MFQIYFFFKNDLQYHCVIPLGSWVRAPCETEPLGTVFYILPLLHCEVESSSAYGKEFKKFKPLSHWNY